MALAREGRVTVVIATLKSLGRLGLHRSSLLDVPPQAHEGMTLRIIGPTGPSRGIFSFWWTRGISVPHTLDPTPLLEVPVHRLDLGDAPLSRKMVDLASVVHVVVHHLSPLCASRPSELLLHLCHQDQLALLESH
jgi:hypothetical protein